MDSYYVVVRWNTKIVEENYPLRRELHYKADSFAHAEEQAKQDIDSDEEIIGIDKDY